MNERSGYWRSLGELADTPEFRSALSREFADGAVDAPGAFTRRRFLQLMSASVALAGFSGCRWPKEKIVPYAHRPEGRLPGEALRFATSSELWGHARGLVATSYDGRPIKIDGNGQDPIGRGASSAIDQAAVLDLYDPDRGRSARRREGGGHRNVEWSDFLAWAEGRFEGLRARRGAGLYFLAGPTSSEAVRMLRRRLSVEMPEAVWLEYEPLSTDHAREGARIAFGRPLRAHVDLEAARAILSLDADLFGDDPAALLHARGFAAGRAPERESGLNRLYVAESVPSTTGSMADHRIPLAPSKVGPFALSVARRLVDAHRIEAPAEIRRALEAAPRAEGPHADVAQAIAEDLAANRGRSVAVAGYRQPPEVHAAAHLINAVLGNLGPTVFFTADPDEERPSCFEAIREAARALEEGRVDTIVFLGGNPAYDAPADLGFAELVRRAPHSVRLGLHFDETSRASEWHLPEAHFLESWDIGRGYDGTLLARQPLIEPLYGGKTAAEIVAIALDGARARSAHDLAREAFGPFAEAEPLGTAFESVWRRFLHDGVLEGSAPPRIAAYLDPRATAAAIERLAAERGAGEGAFEIAFLRDPKVHDGRFANNGWLQETPDPLSKLTWDNAALLAPPFAKRLGVETGDVLRVALGGRELDAPALVLPGVAPGAIGLSLGYGRTAAGRVGDGVGADGYRLRASDSLFFAAGVRVEKRGVRHPLACTQEHHLIDERGAAERDRRAGTLVREADSEEFRHDPEGAMRGEAGHEPPLVSLWKTHEYEGHRWGMAIDLNSCVGCNACVVACQSENNIPVVGKEQVRRQREMHWIRVDRYYRGDEENPSIVHQPVACVHCEHAPCEQVCPVAATVHSGEGLNVMVYNRCIGTRYCSNNCPYKVRRFNFFNYQKGLEPTEKMAMNPEVTVRSRGVMEKCTYCVQRIESAKIRSKNENRPIRDGEIAPACAEACPTRAIVFGDRNDPESRVSRLLDSPRAYAMLGHLNVRPRTEYLARLRNPNPRLATKDEHEHHG